MTTTLNDVTPAVKPTTTQPWYAMSIIGDPLMDERLIYYLGHAWYRMADIGECLDTCSRIEAGNAASWRKEWFATADRLRKVAEASLASQHDLSAGESYLRASSYYLAGLIYADAPTDPKSRVPPAPVPNASKPRSGCSVCPPNPSTSLMRIPRCPPTSSPRRTPPPPRPS